MRTVPLTAVPNQELSLRLDGARWVLRFKEARGVMVADATRDGVAIVTASRVLAGEAVIPYRYQEAGNFLVLTSDDELPDWRQFGVTQSLVYLSPEELEALR